MKFEEIAQVLTEEEGRRVSPDAVKFIYFRALNKLKKRVQHDREYREMLHSYLEGGVVDTSATQLLYEILDSVVKYENE